jgi:hypothetical protein
MTSTASHESDQECLTIINTKCYYQVMKVEKTATQDEIRRAYKKVNPINL